MEKMSLLLSIFRAKKSLSKEEKQREEEEGPCTSCSHEDQHGGYLGHRILSKHLGEDKSHSVAIAREEGTIAATQGDTKFHQGMIEVPLSISENYLKDCGGSSLHDHVSIHIADLEQLNFTALCK